MHAAEWTRYRMVTPAGKLCRLLKVAAAARGVVAFRLMDSADRAIGEEPVPPDADTVHHFGFWVEEPVDMAHRYRLQAALVDGTRALLAPFTPKPADAGDALPLRLDRAGPALRAHLDRRENVPPAAGLADFVPAMGPYLHQHRIIYRKPAAHWSDGLPLGNGTVGATVTGERGRSQTLFLDRADLWAASPEGRPYGRFHAGRLELTFDTPARAPYLQELRLAEAEVFTRDGALVTTARVNAARDVVELRVRWEGPQPLPVRVRLVRPAMPIPERDLDSLQKSNGSWQTVQTPEEMARARTVAAAAPHTRPAVARQGAIAVLTHPLPNMTHAMAAQVGGADAVWRDVSAPRLAAAEAELSLASGREAVIRVAVTSDRDGGEPGETALAVLARRDPPGSDAHADWWRRYWDRCFVEFPDKLIENLWYFGAYHQAAFSRSLDATGFFGLWHPLDHRTWRDLHVADAQTSLLWYAPFAINHLELLLPSHHTFATLLPRFLAHNPGAGALVPHMFAPEWAGGRATFGKANPYKGSVAWLAQNFWWDWLYTRDRAFLADVGYPVIAALADFHAADLVRGGDGRLHCLNSGSPEQNNTAADGVYDRACIGMVLRAAAEAAEALGVDGDRAAAWRASLRDLYPFPADAYTLVETLDNPHPYRCHPVVLFGVHPSGCIEPGSPLWAKADAAYDVATNLFGFHFEDRHATIPGHKGGQEPNGHATAFLMHAAARLRGWREVRRLVYATTVRTQLKRNGLRSIGDPRHDRDLSRMAISEATSGQTSGLSETLVQNYSDHVRIMPLMGDAGTFRFAGLRAHGGFVLAAEQADGALTRLTVHSVKGGRFRVMHPWPGRQTVMEPPVQMDVARLADGAEALEWPTEAGVTYRVTPAGHAARPAPPRVEARDEPRSVATGDWDDFDPPVVYYPDDPVFGQDADGNRVYLGNPADAATDASERAAVSWTGIQALLMRTDWPARQTAARWLGRLTTPEATALLVRLAEDAAEAPVVRYTAGVSLVHQGTDQALAEAVRIARSAADLPHLRREIHKAFGRLAPRAPPKRPG